MANKEVTFDQLPANLKEVAIERNRDINVDRDDWHDPIIEGFVEDMQALGLVDIEASYSGFWSQGDGASFTAYVSDVPKFVKEALGLKYPDSALNNLTINFERKSSRYCHENTCETVVDLDAQEDEMEVHLGGGPGAEIFVSLNEVADHVQEEAEAWRLRKCADLYRSLEKEYDYLQSDEAVADTLEINEYTYEVDEDGDLVD